MLSDWINRRRGAGGGRRRRLLLEKLDARELMAADVWEAAATEESGPAAWCGPLEGDFAEPLAAGGTLGEPPPRPVIDLDADTDHTGVIERSAHEDAIEWRNPGRAVQVNLDDDNHNGVQDYLDAPFVDEQGAPMVDDDLVEAVLSLEANGRDLTGYRVTIGPARAGVNVWASADKQALRPTYVLGKDKLPERIWVEGRPDSASALVLAVLSGPEGDVAEDAVLFSVVDSHLTAYRPQTEGPGYGHPFHRLEVPRDWELPVGIRRNTDDDNQDRTSDHLQTLVQEENDLIEVEIRGFPQFGTDEDFGFRLDADPGTLNVWDSPDKGTSVLGRLVEPGSYWVEWVDAKSSAAAPVTLSIIDLRHQNVAIKSETLFQPFQSTVIVLTGEWQTPHDPRLNGGDHGVMRLAFDAYDNGYDVHLLDEDDVWSKAGGPAFDEIVNAVNHRGVTEVALIGYSHGGGSVYRLSEHLAETRLITQGYVIPLTGYIDAVSQPLLNPLPERRRPLRSLFHSNQYQTNSLLRGAAGSGEDEIDRSPLGVEHLTIDDHEQVRALLQDRLEAKVRR